MSKWIYLDRAANLAVISACAVVMVVLVRNTFLRQPARTARIDSQTMVEMLKGKQINIEGAGLLEPGSRKMLLSLSVTCHFCEQSTPFYQALASLTREKAGVKLIAAFPQGKSEAEEYLRIHKIVVDTVVSARPLAALGVTATPTLILIGTRGEVEQVWVGMLSDIRQREVLASLKGG